MPTPLVHLAIDPGNLKSGWVMFRHNPVEPGGVWVEDYGDDENERLREFFKGWVGLGLGTLSVEMPKAQGMAVANELLETCVQIGRFLAAWPGPSWSYVFRGDVKLAICGSSRAKDGNVRQALIDLWGGADAAIGGKRCKRCHGQGWIGRKHEPCPCHEGWEHPPGPLYRMSGDMWAALGVAYTWSQTRLEVHTLKPSNTPSEVKHDASETD